MDKEKEIPAAATVLTDERILYLAESWAMTTDGYQSAPLNHCHDFARAIEAEVLAQAGVRAEPAFWYDARAKIEKMDLIDGAYQAHLLVCNEKFGDYTTPLYLAAPTIPAQVPAAEVRAQALREAAELCGSIYQNHRDQYKGRGKYAPPADNPRRADPHCDGCADGAAECEEAIRSLAQSSTADKALRQPPSLGDLLRNAVDRGIIPSTAEKASEVRAAEDPKAAQLRSAIEIVCEGWTLPSDARKVLETALWTAPSTADSGNTGALSEEGSFKEVATARGFTDFSLTISGNYFDPKLQALREAYDATSGGNTGALGEGANA